MAASVTEDLDLDVAGAFDVFFEIEPALLEIAAAEPVDLGKGGLEFRRVPAELHADATTAGGALEHHRVADPFRLGERDRHIGQQAGARQQGHALLLRDLARRVFQAKAAHLVRLGADEDDARGRAGLGEASVFAEETIAGMNRLGAGPLGDLENLLRHEVALRRRRRSDQHGFVRLTHVQRAGIRLRIDSYGADTHFPECPDDAASDGTTIGDEDFAEQSSWYLVVSI